MRPALESLLPNVRTLVQDDIRVAYRRSGLTLEVQDLSEFDFRRSPIMLPVYANDEPDCGVYELAPGYWSIRYDMMNNLEQIATNLTLESREAVRALCFSEEVPYVDLPPQLFEHLEKFPNLMHLRLHVSPVSCFSLL